MAILDHSPGLTPEELAPKVETHVFEGHETAPFWVGVVATPEAVIAPVEFLAARQLRANVYIDEVTFLPPEARQADGGESDNDDLRSVHFTVIENKLDGTFRTVGNMRSIHKGTEAAELPVEHYFPEAFADEPAPVDSVEASRFIARHPNRLIQGAISLGLIRAIVANAYSGNKEPIYAVVEEPLKRQFGKLGIPYDEIAPAKPLPEYGNTVNMALRFDPTAIIETAKNDVAGERKITPFFQTALGNLGLGHYDGFLLAPFETEVPVTA